ncbi:lytic transglycosylase domain-containing protein [Roseibaca sp. V10]|uniref:Lytic transglycosylase domain-containing protein n=1 Tax=Roseinatronobacter domitianus TaxID=2940293 RepID=A0ABT0M2X8_9RHOB|nr:lytic transglycosylase domain-containing protein [Roseibaca domitiana]MCL1629201.1 lytic transglycosylase domain-containing protein [Roseibaca domitiana]
MSAVDPRFKEARRRAQGRRRGGKWRWIGLMLALILALGGVGVWLLLPKLTPEIALAPEPEPPAPDLLEPETLSRPADPDMTEDEPEIEGPRASLDLPGDPILLVLGNAVAPQAQSMPRPDGLDPGRGQGGLLFVRGPLLPPGERLAVALPSSQEDFAIFQGQRQRAAQARARPLSGQALQRPPRSVAEARAWVAAQQEADSLLYGSNTLDLRPADGRVVAWRDMVLRVGHTSDMAELLRLENLPQQQAEAAAEAARSHLGGRVTAEGSLLALRLRGTTPEIVQMALYHGDRYVGAVARSDAPSRFGTEAPAQDVLQPASDPWVQQDLPARLGEAVDMAPPMVTAPRVMDALYDAGLRHGLSPGLVGQIIMLLSQTHKLDMQARPVDRFDLLRTASPAADGQGTGSALDQVLFIGVQAEGLDLKCYVYRPSPDRAPACYGQRRGGSMATVSASLVSAPAGGAQTITGSDAVEQLVNRIIQVESAGRADAKNPLSTATGLGQFISSTWLRMMRTYRPDLTASLSRSELLALRTDPEISRAMVLNLAREGESYLRARGHDITAGRLYLAHFLGMDGAHVALSADPSADLMSLFGAGVINANPFLRGHDAAYVVDWAERKMRGRSGRAATRISEPAGLAEFRNLVDAALQG